MYTQLVDKTLMGNGGQIKRQNPMFTTYATPGQDLGVSDAQAIFAAGGGGGDGERDVQMGRERSEKSTA